MLEGAAGLAVRSAFLMARGRGHANPDHILASKRIDADADVRDWLGGLRAVTITEEAVALVYMAKS
jgi:hypothetical protein